MTAENWLPIPVAPKYEINQRGDVRNIRTGKILAVTSVVGHQYSVYLYTDNGQKWCSIANLLWLTHGFIPKRKTHSRIRVPVIVSRGNERYYFDSLRQAGAFIAHREKKHAPEYLIQRLSRRPKEIYGWRINYQR